ncbi:MAG: hypothetical protein RLY11_1323 [Bacteroidota bacterium]
MCVDKYWDEPATLKGTKTKNERKQKTHISVGICLHSNRPYSVKMQLTGPYADGNFKLLKDQ